MKRTLSAAGGVEQVLHIDNADEYRGAIELRQDVAGILRSIERQRQETPGREFRKMAEIPMAVFLQACVEGHANDPEYWKRWFNNPDNAAFRIHGNRA